jgi:hypothetical protein
MIGGLEWKSVEDGEYNEHEAEINGQRIIVFSDRNGGYWQYQVDSCEPVDLVSTDIYDALREAALEMETW